MKATTALSAGELFEESRTMLPAGIDLFLADLRTDGRFGEYVDKAMASLHGLNAAP
jgi:hypothetical protein